MALLRVLCRQPASRDDLTQMVNDDLDAKLYDLDDPIKVRDDFKNDLRELRALGVEIDL
ncbi:MAG: hypothetical protein HC802_19255 [Caldilineaceae bacterium]|nr:hypothetical protein [Caldilineaceae bacterium]